MALALAIIVYGFLASALPVWLLLAPRDYLSTFVKLGVVLMLGVGILFVRPELQLPPFTRFIDGTGPIFAGKIFPFCFITIACGAISRLPFADLVGHHAEDDREGKARAGRWATAPCCSRASSRSWR